MERPHTAGSVSFDTNTSNGRLGDGAANDDVYQMYEDGYDSAMALSRAPNENFKVGGMSYVTGAQVGLYVPHLQTQARTLIHQGLCLMRVRNRRCEYVQSVVHTHAGRHSCATIAAARVQGEMCGDGQWSMP
jgi:hypothetical protein